MAASGTSITSMATIEPLNGSNYRKWRADIEIYLGLVNIDMCLIEDEPAPLSDVSTDAEKVYHKEWTRANRMTKLILKRTMSDTVKGSISDKDTAREYLDSIAEKFKESEKAETGHLLDSLRNMKYDGSLGIREYIMKMIEIATRLKDLNMPLEDEFIVHSALSSLPTQFGQLLTTYNALKEKWSLNELITICVQEEVRLKKGKSVIVNLVGKPNWKSNKLKPKKTIFKASESASALVSAPKVGKPFKFKCYFCKRVGHMKKDCTGFKDWIAKRGLHKEESAKK